MIPQSLPGSPLGISIFNIPLAYDAVTRSASTPSGIGMYRRKALVSNSCLQRLVLAGSSSVDTSLPINRPFPSTRTKKTDEHAPGMDISRIYRSVHSDRLTGCLSPTMAGVSDSGAAGVTGAGTYPPGYLSASDDVESFCGI